MRDSFTNVRQVFLPLGSRLFLYESKNYLYDFVEFDGPTISDKLEIEYKDIMDRIGVEINAFDAVEVCTEAKFYENRIIRTINDLEPRLIEYKLKGSAVTSVETSRERQQALLENWKEELGFYLFHIIQIQEARLSSVDEKTKKDVISEANINYTQINLPEQFKVSDLNKHFKPRLTSKQASMLLHYLRDCAILPPYSDKGLGKLAESFFALHQKNITVGLTSIHELKTSKKDLTYLKEVLDTLQEKIDLDLEEAV